MLFFSLSYQYDDFGCNVYKYSLALKPPEIDIVSGGSLNICIRQVFHIFESFYFPESP